MNPIKLVVFDMAGTTVKDSGQVAEAFSAALAEHHIKITAEQLSNVRGSSKRQAVLNLIPDDSDRSRRAQLVYASFCEHLAQRYLSNGIEPIDDAEQIFQWLRQQGIRVALNTGFDRDITDLLLGSLGWGASVVDTVVCGDDVTHGRPAPDLIFAAMKATGITSGKEVANVGDTVLDLKAGHSAGVHWNVGVLTGAHDRERLKQAPHTHLLPSIHQLCGLWVAA